VTMQALSSVYVLICWPVDCLVKGTFWDTKNYNQFDSVQKNRKKDGLCGLAGLWITS